MSIQHVENKIFQNINPNHSTNFKVRSRKVSGKFNVARICTSECYEYKYIT
jgi:hypothetical protein